MKIEKINDHQIRCTLTHADLADRELKLSELAYGTQKARELFRDMMQQASMKFGFEADDIPLMIEAIPLSGDCIVLNITKVEDPEELDTRFAKFAPSLQEHEDMLEDILSDLPDSADEILDLFRKVRDSSLAGPDSAEEGLAGSLSETASTLDGNAADSAAPGENNEVPLNVTKMFSFQSLQALSRLVLALDVFYKGSNSLYKDPSAGRYYLVVAQSGHSPEIFNRLCNLLSEHGQMERYSAPREAYMEEHYCTLIKETAIASLAIMEKAAV